MQVKLVQPGRQIAVETEGFVLLITAAERGLWQSQVGHAGLEAGARWRVWRAFLYFVQLWQRVSQHFPHHTVFPL